MGVLTVCAVGVFLASPWVMLYRSNCITRLEAFAGGYNSLFSLIPFTLLVALTGPVGGAVFLIILAILHLSIVFHASEFGSLPNGNTFFLLYETTPAEIRDFVAHFSLLRKGRGTFLLFSLCLLAASLASLSYVEFERFAYASAIVAAGQILSLTHPRVARIFFGKSNYTSDGIAYAWSQGVQNPLVLLVGSYIAYREQRRQQLALAMGDADELPAITVPRESPEPEVHVVIVGESAVRSHMGIYGYFRQTTPRLQKRVEELKLFQEVISAHSATIDSIRDMFTFAGHDGEANWHRRGSLIHLLEKAGYNTVWLSNQGASGAHENFAAMLGRSCGRHVFVNASEHYCQKSLDERLLPHLERALAEDRQKGLCIFVHLMGQHFAFHNRYPERFDVFTSSEDLEGVRGDHEQINHYDNATLYNDYVVSETIRLVDEAQVSSTVLYLSDHGMDLFEYSDTASQLDMDGSPPMFEIPFVLWTSRKFRERHSELVAQLDSYVDRKFMTDDLIYSLPDLYGFSWNERDLSRSIFHADWSFRPRIIVDGGRGVARRDFDTQIATLSNESEWRRDIISRQPEEVRDRLWAHACNSVGKLKEASLIFHGVEVDLVFEHGRLDVRHPPSPSINLDLLTLLRCSAEGSNVRYWFDLKNLDEHNAEQCAAVLAQVCAEAGLCPAEHIVESPHARLLRPFKKHNFQTSYYLPTYFLRRLEKSGFSIRSKDDAKTVDEIRSTWKESGVTHASVDGKLLDFVKKYLPEVTTVLAWLEYESPYDYFCRQEILALLKSEPRLDILLVRHPSIHDRY